MEIDDTSEMNGDVEPELQQKKKIRKFSGKEFRAQLQGDQKLIALQNFLQQIKENTSQDCALEYLQKHGNIHEILQCMEHDSTLPPVLIMEIVNALILKIISAKIDCKDATIESCRYFLKNFITTINKMIGLASSSKERIVTIKLLTTIATLSSSLSKDILMHVNFNLTNLELISKNTLENKTVRKHFVFFLTALLIEIEYPTLSLLLEKKGMLTSIIPGLQYDDVDTVCFMLTAMRNNILENQFVSKTVKMKTFNTIVIKSIVNLYNWKGPTNLRSSKKEGAAPVEVDEIKKAKVNECVHDFLLILCTSHKYGVVFRDPMVGMGKKTQNALIYTVLDSMDSPWDHSYASDLVIKICSACPDLTKYVWNLLKTPLEPRYSVKWMNVANFIRRLLEEVKPNCLEPYVKQLNLHQLSQIIPVLVAPLPILKIILPENTLNEHQMIKFKIISIICSMIKSIQSFIEASQKWLNIEKFSKLKNHLADYVERNFPTGQALLEKWNEKDIKNEELKDFNPLDYLSVVFDILENYMKLCPELLDSLKFSHSDLKILLETMDTQDLPVKERNNLQVKIIDLFLDANPAVFSLESDSFSFFLTFLFKTCYENVNDDDFTKCYSVLGKFLKNMKIFDYGSDDEINVWINGIFGVKSLKENVCEFLTEALKLTSSKTVEYVTKMSQMYGKIQNESKNSSTLSPMLMGVLECLNGKEVEKNTISYLNFAIPNLIFLQSDSAVITEFLKGNELLNSALFDYVELIFGEENVSFEINKVLKVFGRNDMFNKFNQALAGEDFDAFLDTLQDNCLYPDLKSDLLHMGVFYFSKLLKLENPQQDLYSKNLIVYIKDLLKNSTFDAKVVLNNSRFIEYFSILDLDESGEYNSCTNFIIDFIRNYSVKEQISQQDLRLFLDKLQTMLLKILKNPKRYSNVQVLNILEIFKMTSHAYFDIITEISNYISDKPLKCKYPIFCSILDNCLEEYCKLSTASSEVTKLTVDIYKNLMNFHVFLNDAADHSLNLFRALLNLFSTYPQSVDYVEENFVDSILNFKEYDKANADLIILILEKRKDLHPCIIKNLDNVISVKGILYPVLQMLSQRYYSNSEKLEIEDIFGQVFVKFEDTLHKIIRKPLKASHHLDNNFQGILLLTELHFKKEKFQEYVNKIQKFEVTKIFHVNLIYIIFQKFIESGADEKIVCNTTVTFVHLLLNILKKSQKNDDDTTEIVNTVCNCFIKHLGNIETYGLNSKLQNVHNNESFKHMIKFCLKYGVSGNEKLLQILEIFILSTHEKFTEELIKSIIEMLVSHSEFLDVVLDESHKCKKGVLSLMLSVCENWPKVMERSHVPVLLSSYGATLSKTDKIALELLKLYESERIQTSFLDFKPYLWGNAGANHYSVRLGIEKALLKQPKMNDVLSILQENIVMSTIKNYILYDSKNRPDDLNGNLIYDLEFLLPLFSHLLAPENVVKTYHFTQSGALSLTIIALSSNKREIREAACHVLARFHFHVEAKQGGKDNLLWIRLIEAICRGIAVTENYVLNNFASIFLAKSALILTQPNHVMYLPLSQYLASKSMLNFSSIPELYTFLHSSDVNFKDHRNFILEILSDGLISENDYNIFFRSMALKLITELYSSCTCDIETKLLILDIVISICRIPLGVKFVCFHNSIIEYLVMGLEGYLSSSNRMNVGIICKLAKIFDEVFLCFDGSFQWIAYLMSNASQTILKSDISHFLPDSTAEIFLKISKSKC